jgi:hypothetical protein
VTAAYLMIPGPEPRAVLDEIIADVVPQISAW